MLTFDSNLFLKMGKTLDSNLEFISVYGTNPVMKEALNTVSRGFPNMYLITLNIPIGMLNGPVDLLTFKFDISVSISVATVGNK